MIRKGPLLLTLGLAGVVSAGVLLSGCAEVVVTHVDDSDNSGGVHFYEPRPYLLVGIQKDQYTSEIIWLPDHSRRYKVTVKPGWGTVDGSVKLTNGWMLAEFGAKSDSKTSETIAAIAALTTGAKKEAAAPPELGLYRIDIDEKGNVTLVKQDAWK